ncbi:MAG: tryptophan 2,3-dioxygenase family protein [Cyanobacteria bacterium P01_D01_bin.116]
MNINRDETYSEILKLEELLSLQQPKTSTIDDRLFIIIHQVCELCFSQILVEITDLHYKFKIDASAGDIVNKCARIVALFDTVSDWLNILKTIKIHEFCTFILNYKVASGAQSFQYHLIEEKLGFTKMAGAQTQNLNTATGKLEHETLREEVLRYIQRNYMGSLCHDSENYQQQRLVDFLMSIIRDTVDYSDALTVVDSLINLDEAMDTWRIQHLRIAQRMIGQKSIGTGGTMDRSGLHKTLNRRLFPEFLEARAKLRCETLNYSPSGL